MLSAAGGCELSTKHVKTAWKKFNELLPVLSSHHFSYKTHGCVYISCFRNVMLHVSETWPLKRSELPRIWRNDRATVIQICNIKPEDVATVRSKKLLAQQEIDYVAVILREKRIRWFVHVKQFSGTIKTFCDMEIVGECGTGRPKTTWMTLTERDLREWKLNELTLLIRVCEHPMGVLPCLQLASYLEGSLLMSMMLLYMHVTSKCR